MRRERLIALTNHKAFKRGLFLLLLLIGSYYYNYHEIISYRPTSVHQWRNSVSASIALNYYHEDEFFHPRTHNMQVDDYTSDITITEFPVIYYFIGMLYRIFGFHEYIYKLVNVLIGFTGLYFLFLLGLRAFRNIWYAIFLPMLLFSSPIYAYYTNNFIPDATSLSIALAGLYFFYLFYKNGSARNMVLSLSFLCLAGLLKTPALILYFAIGGLFLLETVFKIRLDETRTVFRRSPLHLIGFALVFLIIVGWYAYAKIYTDVHGGIVSLVEIRPIWNLSTEYIGEIREAMKERFNQGIYHSPLFLALSLLLLIHNIICWKKYDKLVSLLVMLTLFGGISFTLMFYRSMKQHDYYQLNNLIIPIMILLNFLLYLKNNREKIFHSIITKGLIGILVVVSFISSGKIMEKYYYGGWFYDYAQTTYNHKYDKITPYLRSLGIERTDKVYCTYDPSINISLYLMDQKGFTDFAPKGISFQERVSFYTEKGCKYVIIGNYDRIDIEPEKIGLVKIGEYNGAGIYTAQHLAP